MKLLPVQLGLFAIFLGSCTSTNSIQCTCATPAVEVYSVDSSGNSTSLDSLKYSYANGTWNALTGSDVEGVVTITKGTGTYRLIAYRLGGSSDTISVAVQDTGSDECKVLATRVVTLTWKENSKPSILIAAGSICGK